MSEFCNFEGSIPEVSKTFIHLFSILKIKFFVITFFFSKVLLSEYELFGQKLFKQVSQASTSQVEEARDKYESRFGLFYNFYHNEID
jgi:hypothetical protein